MAAGFYDLLAWMLGWKSAQAPPSVTPPYCVEASHVFVPGSRRASIHAGGSRRSNVFCGGAEKEHVTQ